jgi:hypothetical protein
MPRPILPQNIWAAGERAKISKRCAGTIGAGKAKIRMGMPAEWGKAGWLPNPLAACIDPPPRGHVAEWLRSGLQNRLHQFNSGRGLHQ